MPTHHLEHQFSKLNKKLNQSFLFNQLYETQRTNALFLSRHFYHGPEFHNLSKLQPYEIKNENHQIKFQKLYLKLVIITF